MAIWTNVSTTKHPNPGEQFGVMWMGLSKQHYGILGHQVVPPSSVKVCLMDVYFYT
ncbi:hypothetical protein ACI2OX_04640 [Bacillus sp. N9]